MSDDIKKGAEALELIKAMKRDESLIDDLHFYCPDDNGLSYMSRIDTLLGIPD